MKLFGLILLVAHAATLASPPAYRIEARIAIGGEGRWDYIVADSEQHRLYVAHTTTTEVIDTRTNTQIGSISGTNGVHGIAIAKDLGRGYISNGKDDSVMVFDLASLAALETIKVGANPDAIVYDAKSKRVVTFNGRSNDATIVDARRGTVVATLPVGGKPEFALQARNGLIYFNIEDTNELVALDVATARLVRRHSLAPCEGPTGLAIDPSQRLYSVCENQLMVVSAPDGHRVGQAPIGTGSDGVVWLDGFAFSANGADGTISMVTAAPGGRTALAQTIASAPGARTIAADPATHKLYLPSASFMPAQDGGRPKAIPGTFEVIVLAP